MFSNIITYFGQKPRRVFLLDATGALVTTFFLAVVWMNFNEVVGMPKHVLKSLALVATCFLIFSSSCFLFLKNHWIPVIRVIGMANLLYCALTGVLSIVHRHSLTTYGWIYLLGEMMIVLTLAIFELAVDTAIKHSD